MKSLCFFKCFCSHMCRLQNSLPEFTVCVVPHHSERLANFLTSLNFRCLVCKSGAVHICRMRLSELSEIVFANFLVQGSTLLHKS